MLNNTCETASCFSVSIEVLKYKSKATLEIITVSMLIL